MYYYEVAPNQIVRSGVDFLTYSSDTELAVGHIVKIPVGKKEMIGVITKQVSRPKYETKPVLAVVVKNPMPEPLIETVLWMSRYYASPLATSLQTVLPRGVSKQRRKKPTVTSVQSRKRTHFVLNRHQSSAVDKFMKMKASTALLHGITGSGKTAVYIELAKHTLAAGKSVVVLVPEIALTSQLVSEFSNHFPNILLTHSKQTEAERHLVWNEAIDSPEPRIVVGPRSALFTPLKSIGLVVIDECHEPSFKQEQSPRYSALRVATILVRNHGAKAIFGSATPSVADYYLADSTNSPILSLPELARPNATKASVEIVDMTNRKNFTKHHFLSDKLINDIEKTLSKNKQVLIFHNRRGTAPTTLCESCGWSAGCPLCFVPLTLHADHHTLRCHICNYATRVPTHCPECKEADIIHKGIGTKLIESELRKIFPNTNISRFDGDTSDTDTVDKRYSEIYDGSIQIIIGTQVIAKGLDLPHLQTVGIVQADAGLSLPDYQSSERTFQLLSQAIGRVGRSSHKTKVIAQSYQPNHPSILDGINQNYQDFYSRTVEQRRRTNFPPFCFLLKLTCTYKTEKTAIKNSQEVAKLLKSIAPKSVEVLGPAPAFYERRGDTYRWQIVLKSSTRSSLVDILDSVPKQNWQSELDPISLL
ncbi:primosomal protein N' [Candidatus Nomurabacteria bacterium]|nr:primosomal protein N' [Candidatus Nomurabacteria bacterium]